jgi:hypothetical protein
LVIEDDGTTPGRIGMASVRMALWPLMLQNMAGLGQDGNKVVHHNAGFLPGFSFLVNFCTVAANYFGNFQIFSVNSKTNCQTFKTHKIDKKKTLVASSFFSSFHFLSNILQIYYIPFFMPDKMEGMSRIEGQVTPTYP